MEWISPEGARAPQVLSSFSHPTSRMSDLGLLVAAALRDKVVEDLLSENRRLRREIEELQDQCKRECERQYNPGALVKERNESNRHQG